MALCGILWLPTARTPFLSDLQLFLWGNFPHRAVTHSLSGQVLVIRDSKLEEEEEIGNASLEN